MTDQRADDIKAISDDVATDAEELAAIENEKGRLAADDPRLIELAREAEDLATDVLAKTKAERQLVGEAAAP